MEDSDSADLVRGPQDVSGASELLGRGAAVRALGPSEPILGGGWPRGKSLGGRTPPPPLAETEYRPDEWMRRLMVEFGEEYQVTPELDVDGTYAFAYTVTQGIHHYTVSRLLLERSYMAFKDIANSLRDGIEWQKRRHGPTGS